MASLLIAAPHGKLDSNIFFSMLKGAIAKIDSLDEIVLREGNTLAERWAIDYANKNGIQYRLFPAYWKKEGEWAGLHRNQQLTMIIDYGLVFWDGFNKDIRYLLNELKRTKIPTKLVILEMH